MASSASVTSSVPARRRAFVSPTPAAETRFDRRLSKILFHATEVFYEKGYAGASMRDLSRVSGISLSGLYYYFESKEKLLYLMAPCHQDAVLGLPRFVFAAAELVLIVDTKDFHSAQECGQPL